MRILHVCNHFYPNVGGIETYVRELSKNLIKLGHTSDVLCLDTEYKGRKLPKEEVVDGIKVMRTSSLDFKFYKFAPHVLGYVKGYDIVHVHAAGFFSDFFSLTKPVHKKRLVLSTHGGIFHTKKIMTIKNLYFFLWEKLVLRNFDQIFAHSVNDKELFSLIAPRNKINLVPYSLYFKDYRVARKVKKNSMLFVGRFGKNKRIDRLIRILRLVSENLKDVKLVLVGGYLNDDKGLFDMAKRLGVEKDVVSLGPKYGNALIKYYASAHVFVSAAEYEGFGISVIEAMAAGCPVVVNDIKAFRNFVAHGKNGYLVDYSNERGAANLITKILKSDLSGISRNAKKYAKRYDWSIGTAKAVEIYKKLV